MSEASKSAFWEKTNEGFAEPDPSMDLLHPDARKSEPGYRLTETQYLGFNLPEHDLHALAYMWYHPNLGTVSGGVYAWTGMRSHSFECELFDFVGYMDDECLANDLWDYRFENSYHVQTLEPLKAHRIRYDDPARSNSFDLRLDAIMPPMVHESGLHLEQAMRVNGEITLRGKTYELKDTYTVRDRSWGALRSEKHVNAMPLGWMTGIRGEDFVFGAMGMDNPESSPDAYPGIVGFEGGTNLKAGWIYQDSKLIKVVSMRKRTTRDPLSLNPLTVDITLTDANGIDYEINGTITAAAPWQTWQNFETWICLVRWEYDGTVFYGDLQECHWSDFVRAARTKA